ncbi:hypothetical protein ACJX0J_030711, partial [Zea mays]
ADAATQKKVYLASVFDIISMYLLSRFSNIMDMSLNFKIFDIFQSEIHIEAPLLQVSLQDKFFKDMYSMKNV